VVSVDVVAPAVEVELAEGGARRVVVLAPRSGAPPGVDDVAVKAVDVDARHDRDGERAANCLGLLGASGEGAHDREHALADDVLVSVLVRDEHDVDGAVARGDDGDVPAEVGLEWSGGDFDGSARAPFDGSQCVPQLFVAVDRLDVLLAVVPRSTRGGGRVGDRWSGERDGQAGDEGYSDGFQAHNYLPFKASVHMR